MLKDSKFYFLFSFLIIIKLYSLYQNKEEMSLRLPSLQRTIVNTEVQSLLISQSKNLFNARGNLVYFVETREEQIFPPRLTKVLFQRTPCSPVPELGWPRTPATGRSCRLRGSRGGSQCSCSIRDPGMGGRRR